MSHDRVWLCALDLDVWEQVAPLLHPASYPSPRLPEDARIASAATDALIRVAVHEIAGPDLDSASLLNPEPLRHRDTSLPFDKIHYSVSHSPHALAVAVSLRPVGIDIEPIADTVDWRPLSHGVVDTEGVSPDLRSPNARASHDLARIRAATRASGEATSIHQCDHPVQGTGWVHLGGADLFVSDVAWRRDHAVSMAAYTDDRPLVLQSTASQVLERWREITLGTPAGREQGREGSQGSARLA